MTRATSKRWVPPVERPTIATLERMYGEPFFDHQREAVEDMEVQVRAHAAGAGDSPSPRLCLYFRTGAGKTVTALASVAVAGCGEVLVLAPPVTHDAWRAAGELFGVEVTAISHAKFRERGYLVRREVPIIADEFHLLGGQGGVGWKKFDRLARAFTAPLIIMSATPNYNDVERCYCIEHVMDARRVKGGYIEFIYQHCETEENPFAREPKVLGFRKFPDAEHYLKAIPHVHHLPDNVTTQIDDVWAGSPLPDEFEEYGLNRRRGRIMASQMEERHAIIRQQLIDDRGYIRDHVYEILTDIAGQATTPILVFCNTSTVATHLASTLDMHGVSYGLVTGSDSTRAKTATVEAFKQGAYDVLVGTATLATGTDGIDKVCDTLVILEDTDDDALRRQLVGRILPRGKDVDATGKHVYRLVLNS